MLEVKNQISYASVEEHVAALLRTDVLELRRLPGSRLRVAELAAQYQVSPTPVREALLRLEGEGLVTTTQRRGACVAPRTLAELQEIQAVRAGVEGRLARIGAMRCRERHVREMAPYLAGMERAYATSDVAAYLNCYRQAREVCYLVAERPRLFRVAAAQYQRAGRYVRCLIRDVSTLGQSREHQHALLEACRARDGEAAQAVTRAALDWTLEQLEPLLITNQETE